MSVFNNYKAGLWNVGSYQVAGIPYVTGTNPGSGAHAASPGDVKRFVFPTVTKRVTVINKTSDPLRISFVPFSGVGSGAVVEGMHYIELDSDEDAIDMNVKCAELYVSGTAATCRYHIIAELTGIPAKEMFALTGSGLTD